MPFPIYDIPTETLGHVLERKLYDEINDLGPYTTTFQSVVVNHDSLDLHVIFDIAPDIAEQAIVDAIVNAHGLSLLSVAKCEKVASIDERTEELIQEGYEYPPASGIMFSLSENAQRSLIAGDAQRLDPLFPYPVEWNNKDDTSTIVFNDAASFHLFVMTAVGKTRAMLDSGTVIKSQVRAAVDIVAVNAIVDGR